MSLSVEPTLRHALGLHQMLPVQCATAAPASAGLRRFYAALLALAVDEAGLAPRRGTGLPRASRYARTQARTTARTLARLWLAGELEAEVTVPVAVACAALGLDAAALADAVRRLGCP